MRDMDRTRDEDLREDLRDEDLREKDKEDRDECEDREYEALRDIDLDSKFMDAADKLGITWEERETIPCGDDMRAVLLEKYGDEDKLELTDVCAQDRNSGVTVMIYNDRNAETLDEARDAVLDKNADLGSLMQWTRDLWNSPDMNDERLVAAASERIHSERGDELIGISQYDERTSIAVMHSDYGYEAIYIDRDEGRAYNSHSDMEDRYYSQLDSMEIGRDLYELDKAIDEFVKEKGGMAAAMNEMREMDNARKQREAEREQEKELEKEARRDGFEDRVIMARGGYTLSESVDLGDGLRADILHIPQGMEIGDYDPEYMIHIVDMKENLVVEYDGGLETLSRIGFQCRSVDEAKELLDEMREENGTMRDYVEGIYRSIEHDRLAYEADERAAREEHERELAEDADYFD